LKKLKLVRICF